MTKNKRSTRHQPTDSELDEQVDKKMRLSVVDNTNVRHRMKIVTMKGWLTKRDPLKVVMDAKDFQRFLVDHRGVKSGKPIASSSGKVWKAAWEYWRDTGMEVEVSDMDKRRIKRQLQGTSYNGGAPVRHQANAIDSGRLRALTTLFVQWGVVEYAMFLIFLFYTAYRKTVAKNVLVGDIREKTDKGTLVHSSRMKSARPDNIDVPGLLNNFKEVNNLTAFLAEAKKGKKESEKLFPNVCDDRCNTLIKKAAQVLGWGPGKWCILSFRHGTSREGQAVIAEDPLPHLLQAIKTGKQLSLRMGHTDIKSKSTYQNSNKKLVLMKLRAKHPKKTKI